MTRPKDRIDPTRRQLLGRLGLAGTIAYVAPALTAFGTAKASGASGASGPSSPSGPSGPSGPSRASGGQSERRATQRSVPSRPAPRQSSTRPTPAAPAEMILFAPEGLSLAAAEAAGYRVIAKSANRTLAATMLRLGLPPGRTVETARTELAGLLPEAISDANHLYRPDEFLCADGTCAAHEMIGWSGWPSAFAPRIGMIDTGINPDHDALQNQRLTVHQADLAERSAAGRQHGTAIAAMLIGRLDSRVPGLLPHAELVAVEAFHRDGAGEAADAFSLVAAIDLLLEAGVSVINMSFSGPANAVLERMTTRAVAQGVGLVAAAGNGGAGAEPAFPAAWPHVLAVTAVDHRLNPYRQANRGDYVSLAAPGVGVWTAASVSGGRLRSGTSYAAPFVTAALAVERMRTPEMPLNAVMARLIGCAQDLGPQGHDPAFGHGLVSAPGQCFATGDEKFLLSGD